MSAAHQAPEQEREALAEAHAEAERRYRGPRMYVGTVTDREVAAFEDGAAWAASRRPAPEQEAVSDEVESALRAGLHDDGVVYLSERDIDEIVAAQMKAMPSLLTRSPAEVEREVRERVISRDELARAMYLEQAQRFVHPDDPDDVPTPEQAWESHPFKGAWLAQADAILARVVRSIGGETGGAS